MQTIKVLMLGGRRCGKTTILANMCRNIAEVLTHAPNEGPTLFTLSKEPQSIVKLNHAFECINGLFEDHSCFDEFIIDDNQTREEGHIILKLSPIDHCDPLKFDFIDIPGEWCLNEPGKVIEHIRNAQVIILAIDTPSMIEENGTYFEYCNKHEQIYQMIQKALGTEFIKDERSQKLLLFVPLKCEKYLVRHDGQILKNEMKRICNEVKSHYTDMINFLRNEEHCNKITMAITPILTICEVRWAEYILMRNNEQISIYDDQGHAKQLEPFDRLSSKFGFVESLYHEACNKGQHSAFFCEQPLIYTVAFVIKYAQYLDAHPQKWKKIICNIPIFGWILNMLGSLWNDLINLFTTSESYPTEFERLRNKKMMRTIDGYEILQNPLGI